MPTLQSNLDVTINGRAQAVPAGLTITGLLTHLELDPRIVVVERNRGIVNRADYERVGVESGDQYELVHFVGGG